MDADLIERLAREAGGKWPDPAEVEMTRGELHRFAAIVAEECARVCDDLVDDDAFPDECAAAIRAKFPPS